MTIFKESELWIEDQDLVDELIAEQIINDGIKSGLKYSDFVVAMARLRRQYMGIPNLSYENELPNNDLKIVEAGLFLFNPLNFMATTPYKKDPVLLSPSEGRIFHPLLMRVGEIIPYNRLFHLVRKGEEKQLTLRHHAYNIRRKLGDSEKENIERGRSECHLRINFGNGFAFHP